MADSKPKQIPVVFYRTSSGTEVVRDWLQGLDTEDRQAIGLDLMRVQFRWPLAGRNAAMQVSQGWTVGSENDAAKSKDRANLILHPRRSNNRAFWLHQEDPENA